MREALKDSPTLGTARSVAVFGAASAIAFTFPLAVVTAVLYRFPVPFAGYMSGTDALIPAIIATALYGCLGGFVVVGAGGAAVGVLIRPADGPVNVPLLLAGSASVALAGVLIMAVLDKLIGPF